MKKLAAAAIALSVVGCATLPPPAHLPASHAERAGPDTSLRRMAIEAQPDAELTGFRLMPSGDFALSARLELAKRAERTLDLQYYQLENDEVGRTVLRALRDAALRGVRVRLLIDDLYTSGEDELLLAFAATPNVELRLFNPFPAGRSSMARRFAASVFDFARVNRRMHNKLFIADDAVAIAGGRNLGNAYFAQDAGGNFLDIDAVVAGALVPRLGSLFDMYWNSAYVRPIQDIVPSDVGQSIQQARFEALTGPASTPPPRAPAPNDVLGYAPLGEDLAAGHLGLIWAQAEAFADSPDRVIDKQTNYGGAPLLDVESVRYNVIEQIRRARKQVTNVSPYLIVGDAGLEELGVLRQRGVEISVVTNSLASTDEPLVYTAYRRYRSALLRLGVGVWELGSERSSSSVRLGLLGTQVGRLHAKSAVIDGRVLFIGSMNFDPRSATQNTEIGIIVQSEVLAAQVLKLGETLRQQGAWRLRRVPLTDRVEWVGGPPGSERVLDTDPDTTFWDRALPTLLAPLLPESLL